MMVTAAIWQRTDAERAAWAVRFADSMDAICPWVLAQNPLANRRWRGRGVTAKKNPEPSLTQGINVVQQLSDERGIYTYRKTDQMRSVRHIEINNSIPNATQTVFHGEQSYQESWLDSNKNAIQTPYKGQKRH